MVLWEGWKFWTSFASTLLEKMDPKKWFPKIARFAYGFSQDSYLLQACDLMANLVYNALKYELGVRSGVVKLKRQMLDRVMPDFGVDADLKQALEISSSKDGTQLVCAKMPSFSGCFQLEPANSC